jgi:hypothetical protein
LACQPPLTWADQLENDDFVRYRACGLLVEIAYMLDRTLQQYYLFDKYPMIAIGFLLFD